MNHGKQKEMLYSVQTKYKDLEGLVVACGMTDLDLAMIDGNCDSMMSDDEGSHASAGQNQ
jgi:hypothetical protein